jgi:hypothetical protein
MASGFTSRAASGDAGIYWQEWPVADVMRLRLCDLALEIEGSWLEERIERVLGELAARDLRFRPHFWLSDEWFSPDGVPGVAIPFYLAHPRLTRIERRQMLQVEGAGRRGCLRILRHEVGHAIQSAYELHRRRRWQLTFGPAGAPYPDEYRPNPGSRRFVQHLDDWYAQSHPVEDFAETFAVWLDPRSDWRRRYAGWPALAKLERVEELMGEIAGSAPRLRGRSRPDSLSTQRQTLAEHYAARHDRYAIRFSEGFDDDLRRLFPVTRRERPSAAAVLRKQRKEIFARVAPVVGDQTFSMEQIFKEMIGRCRELSLVASGSQRKLADDFALVLAVQTTRCLNRRGERCRL